ncbi:17468_t:CDS:2 [Rhizophagus irregularis]|nr:17468_t:CDS:2 [Rhizophagus irregularis]
MANVSPKYEDLKDIFVKCGEEMEWEAIEKAAVKSVVCAAESHEVIQKFTTLNDEFTKRVKETDPKNMNEKRATKSQEKMYKKR